MVVVERLLTIMIEKKNRTLRLAILKKCIKIKICIIKLKVTNSVVRRWCCHALRYYLISWYLKRRCYFICSLNPVDFPV